MQYIVKGMFRMVVDASSAPEAKHEAERVLKGEGIKAIALDAMEKRSVHCQPERCGVRIAGDRGLLNQAHKKKPEDPPNVYEARERGREYCQTNGSDHYILPGVEAMDLIISLGYAEHFCLASIIKYAARYGESGNPEELKKIADYAHILCGVQAGGG
jgi:hypothetical protein